MSSNKPASIRLNPKRGTTILKYDLYCALGRQALGVALQTLGQGHLGILLPEFICRDVPETCHRMGFTVHWYSVDKKLRPVGLARKPACRAILAVHYFGFPQDLRPFQAYCRRTGARLIEDAAHAFLSRNSQGKSLGTAGDFGIFSFRKSLPLPNGAGLIAQPPLRKHLLSLEQSRQQDGNLQDILWKFKKTFAKNFPRLSCSVRRFLRPLARLRSRIQLTSNLQYPFRSLTGALRNLSEQQEILRRRRAWAKFYRLGAKAGVRPVFSHLPPNTCPYGYAFWGKFKDPIMEKAAEEDGFSVIRWPDFPKRIQGQKKSQQGSVGLVNFLLPIWK